MNWRIWAFCSYYLPIVTSFTNKYHLLKYSIQQNLPLISKSTRTTSNCLHNLRFIPFFLKYSYQKTIQTMSSQIIELKKETFIKPIHLVALRIKPQYCSQYLSKFQAYSFQRPKFKRIYDVPNDSTTKYFLLSESIHDLNLSDLPEELKQFHLESQGTQESYTLTLNYEHYTADEVLTTLFDGVLEEIPSSFEQAGHLAHMNLREEALPYKHIIGQVILDKNPTLKTVVNKIGNIETEYRTFPLEVLAGEANFEVKLVESNASFTFNFADVYWNSRLQMEHSRIINNIRHEYTNQSLIVADMMAGVGPFAVPLAMSRVELPSKKTINPIIVHANDLNPASYKYLVMNSKNNKCTSTLFPYNMDGRQFMIQLLEEQGILPHHILMNLPQTATDFLDTFIGYEKRYHKYLISQKKFSSLESDSLPSPSHLPIIHVYAFSTYIEDPIEDIINRVAGILRCSSYDIKNTPFCEGHNVRSVSPKKVMVCLSFSLPKIVSQADIVVFSNKKRSFEDISKEESSTA